MEVQTGGSDTLNSGLFDTAATGKPTDLTTNANTANTSAPIVSSATYNFVAQDIGNWLFVQAGTNWIPGWYNITAVSGNKATLNAAIGAAILTNYTASTAVGCATVGTPTAGTWAVDYSQQGGVQFSLTGLTTAAANAILLSAAFTKAMVGNGIQITGGTNFTTGFYQINAVTAGVSATVDRNVTSAAGLAGTAGIGGALASPGQAGAIAVNGSDCFIKTGTYTVTSASSNVAGGCLTTPASSSNTNIAIWQGYSAIRCDGLGRPVIKADGVITTFTLITGASGAVIYNIEADGNTRTSSRGFSIVTNTRCDFCVGRNCTNSAFFGPTSPNSIASRCYATTCSTQPAFGSLTCWNCTANANTITGFSSGSSNTLAWCVSSNNSGASSDGFNLSGTSQLSNCTSYTNGRDGVLCNATTVPMNLYNIISYGNAGSQFNASGSMENVWLISCACVSGGINSTNLPNQLARAIGFVTLTSDPTINGPGGDFRLTAAAIALIGNAGLPGAMPGLPLSVGYNCIGALVPKFYYGALVGNEELIAV